MTYWDEERELKLPWWLLENDWDVRSFNVHCPNLAAESDT